MPTEIRRKKRDRKTDVEQPSKDRELVKELMSKPNGESLTLEAIADGRVDLRQGVSQMIKCQSTFGTRVRLLTVGTLDVLFAH